MSIRAKAFWTATVIGTALLLPGCYRPQGPAMNYTGAPHTYWSTQSQPKTVIVVDTRTEEEIFAMEIPPGQQLVVQFVKGPGDDPVYRPDIMKYRVMPLGKTSGSLDSQLTVPSADARRVDVYLRRGPEYPPAPANEYYRTDQMSERPDWWTPEGGPLPDDRRAAAWYDQ